VQACLIFQLAGPEHGVEILLSRSREFIFLMAFIGKQKKRFFNLHLVWGTDWFQTSLIQVDSQGITAGMLAGGLSKQSKIILSTPRNTLS